MDPNEALRQIRESASRYLDSGRHVDAGTLAEHVEALDEWLSRGGFLPDAWTAEERLVRDPEVKAPGALPECSGCGLPVDTADDGTVFVFGTGTSADGLSYCPPDPDGEPDGTHTLPAVSA